ncbi:hypothetical protein D1007_35211 [Hordeum vulgare]|nr:hypothetical protein D1007_35211 [Hordeum vulgare]
MALHCLDLLNDDKLCSGDRKRLDALSHIHTMQTTPVRRLGIDKFRSNYKAKAKFHERFLSPALYQLEELSFVVGYGCAMTPSTLYLAPTLRRATFRECLSSQINVACSLHIRKPKDLELIVEVGFGSPAPWMYCARVPSSSGDAWVQ